ncbi:hypothetical protein FRB99_003189 [Tulasnella sp. 403]|nr:hypothetical protein FRB99_003189 [Tulasnella sp. 403]
MSTNKPATHPTSRPLPQHTFFVLVPPLRGAKGGPKSTVRVAKAAPKRTKLVPCLGAMGGPKSTSAEATPKRKAVAEPEVPDESLGRGKRQRKLSRKVTDPNNIA